MTNQPHFDGLETAFLQLSFSIKLWSYLRASQPFDKDAFDSPLIIEDQSSRVCLPQNEFSTLEEIQIAAENNISICFGAAAITLWEAIREHSGLSSGKLNPKSSPEDLAALSYMIRCCFAHGTTSPVWSIYDNKYRTTYRVGNKIIDLTQIKDKQPFDYPSIGGYETLWLLKAEAQAKGLL